MIFPFLVSCCKEQMLKEGKSHYFSGETNLVLSDTELKERLIALNADFLETLNIEKNVFESNDLIRFVNSDAIIPDWDLFITQLDSFHGARFLPEL